MPPLPPPHQRTVVLYTAAKHTPPDAQGWSLLTTGGGETPPGQAGEATTFSTLGSDAFQGGYVLLSSVPLRRAPGYTLAFDLQVLEEKHSVPNRAGVDLIVIGSDGTGLELDFWQDQVWAQSDRPLFLHAEGATVRTGGVGGVGLVHYALAIHGDRYRLSVNGVPRLTGPVRDYRAFQGALNPYRTPNLIFFGDDTKAARGKFRIGRVVLEPITAASPRAGAGSAAGRRPHRAP